MINIVCTIVLGYIFLNALILITLLTYSIIKEVFRKSDL